MVYELALKQCRFLGLFCAELLSTVSDQFIGIIQHGHLNERRWKFFFRHPRYIYLPQSVKRIDNYGKNSKELRKLIGIPKTMRIAVLGFGCQV